MDQDPSIINGQKFNVGSSDHNFNILSLAYIVRENIPFPIEIEVVPDDQDKRSYHVSFEKIKNILGYEPKLTPGDGVKEIYEALKQGSVDTGERTVTVGWYKHIIAAKQLVDSLVINNRCFYFKQIWIFRRRHYSSHTKFQFPMSRCMEKWCA